MCGIFGIMQHGSDAIPDKRQLEESARLIQHRGPDYQDMYAEPGVGLVHTRLSLLDLSSRSHQPFWDRKRRFCLVYNGEIYNYQLLRAELEEKGIQFRSSSDTEVLLECLIHYGLEPTLVKLEGMFAFAFYDTQEQSLSLARDRLGIKPLHIYDGEDVFLFASEIQAMRPWIKFEPDWLSISAYLNGHSGGPMKGYTFYKNVMTVNPGTFMTIRKGGRLHYQQFFSLSDFWDPEYSRQLQCCKANEIVDKFEELLFQSTKMQLVADAPVGAFCSGGVDSSLIMAMAARCHNNLAIFHADVVGPHSEYQAASALAKHLKLDLQTVEIRDQDYIDTMPEVMKHYGHPFSYHPNSAPFLMVSKLINSHKVKAVLSGEGADECYIGYPWLIFDIRSSIGPYKTPKALYHLLRRTVGRLLGRSRSQDRRYRIDDLYNRFEMALENEEIRKCVQQGNDTGSSENVLKTLNQLSYHLRTLLHRNDRLGMASSIEARFPILDSQLVKLAVNMPYNCKVRFSPTTFDKRHYFLIDKWVLRKVAARYLPAELSHRKKMGFPVDVQNRLEVKAAFFNRSFISDAFGLRQQEIQFMIDQSDQKFKQKLFHLEVWAQVCLLDQPEKKIADKLREYTAVSAY